VAPEPVEGLVRAAVEDDMLWARLESRFGPERLRLACQHAVGAMLDEHRSAMEDLPAAALAGWLVRHRQERAAVEVRLARVEEQLERRFTGGPGRGRG
jgi:hypothetical protein